MKKLSVTVVAFLLLSVNIFAQNVGVGTNNPSQKLHVAGNIKGDTAILEGIKITDNAALGSVLTSNDAAGNAKWVKPVKVFFKASGWSQNFNVAYNAEVKFTKWRKVDFEIGENNIFGGDFYYNPVQGDFFVLRPGLYRVSVKVLCFTDNPTLNYGSHFLNIKQNDVAVASAVQSVVRNNVVLGIPPTDISTITVSTLLVINNQDKITFTFKNSQNTNDGVRFTVGSTLYPDANFNEFTIEKVD